MDLKELIEKLQVIYAANGNLHVECDTQDGAAYSPTDFEVMEGTNVKTGEKTKFLFIS